MEKQESKGFFIDDWQVTPAEGLLKRGHETARIEPKAMEVLVYLASSAGEVITREQLERDVWHGALVGYDAVTSTVIKLRKALQDNARQPHYIATIPKKGYQLIAPVTYTVGKGGDDPITPPQSAPLNSQTKKRHLNQPSGMLITALAGVVVLLLAWLWLSTPSQTKSVAPATVVNNAVLPSIAVLPFENLGDDPKQDYLADGITEDIITDLSRFSNLLVIASNTSFQYKGKQMTPEEVRTDLAIEYVLKGSIRQLGDDIRVNAQLVNAKTGFNIWADRYDRKATEVFAVQDEVMHRIVEALAVKMTSQEKNRLAKKTTNSLKAYDSFHEGLRLFRIGTKETNEEARAMYRKAIELDPDYGRAYGGLAYTLATDFRRGWTDSPVMTLDLAVELAKKAVALDYSTPQTHFALGYVYLMNKEFDKAEKAAEQSILIAPNYADGYGLLALISNHLGQAERAIELTKKGMSLNPYYSYEYLFDLGIAYYTLGDYDKAIAVLEEAQDRNENLVHVKLFLTASYVMANRQDDAEWIVEQLEILSPAASITGLEKTIPLANPEFKRAFLENLRKAGLPP